MPTTVRTRADLALTGLRVVIAALIAAHGWARLTNGAVAPFGEWLGGQGLPFGHVVAHGITWLEILGTPLLAWGRWIAPLCLGYAAVLLCGVVLVHASEGWFVVGLGRNGAEYSVLLITGLLCVAWGQGLSTVELPQDLR